MNKDDLLKTPRGRAIIKLGLYLVFFIIVAFLFHAGNDISNEKPLEPKTPMETYSSMTNYEYTYLYNDTLINGKVYRDIKYFNINEDYYYVNKNVYKVIGENNTIEPIELDKLYYLDNHDISEYLEKSNIIGKNEDYENDTIAITYSIDVSDIDLDIAKMDITTYEKDNLIFKVLVKIGSIDTYSIDSSLTDYKVDTIEINYLNINSVNNFIKDFKVKE